MNNHSCVHAACEKLARVKAARIARDFTSRVRFATMTAAPLGLLAEAEKAAFLKDLKAHGMLDDTLVIWGGEFGRTPMSEARQTKGRNHHIDAFTLWMAGGGIKPANIVGETDEFGFGAIDQECHVHDLHATVLHQLGLDHKRLSHRFQGRDFRLTDVEGRVVRELLA